MPALGAYVCNIRTLVARPDFVEVELVVLRFIILDVILVDNMGLNILNALKNRFDAPPVIVYTQSLQRDWIVKILSSGAKSYIVKPQKPQVLVQKSHNAHILVKQHIQWKERKQLNLTDMPFFKINALPKQTLRVLNSNR